jgi:hypothetical protein
MDVSQLLFNFALQYAIKKVRENQLGLLLNGTNHLLAYVDNVNLLGYNTGTVKKSTESALDTNWTGGWMSSGEENNLLVFPEIGHGDLDRPAHRPSL